MPVAATRAFIYRRARKLLGTRSTMPGLVHGGGDREARPWGAGARRSHGSGPACPDPWNVSSWRDPALRQEADLVRERGQRASVEVSRAQMNSVSSAVMREPCDARGTWTGLGLPCCPPGLAPLVNPGLLEIFLVTMETSLRENPRLAEQEWRRCLSRMSHGPCMTRQRRMSTYREVQIYISFLTALGSTRRTLL